MSNFIPTKQHLREALLFCFNLKKNAAESYRLIEEAYGEYGLSENTCRNWFRRFKKNDFNLKDKQRSGQPKKFKDEELKALLAEDPCQTLEKLAEILNVDESTVSKRLKGMGIIQKDGNWLGYDELKEIDIDEKRSTLADRQKTNL